MRVGLWAFPTVRERAERACQKIDSLGCSARLAIMAGLSLSLLAVAFIAHSINIPLVLPISIAFTSLNLLMIGAMALLMIARTLRK